jgi:pimeloyl-ACP methyl ester carboxylesterase
MYFSLLYPERVAKLLALEPGLAALVHLRNDKDWIGWAAWVAKLEEVGIHVPEDKRTDAEFLLQLSLETPKFYGPARGLPRNREPLLHLIRNTTLLKDYEVVGDMTLDAVRTIQTPTLLVYGRDSHFISSYELPAQGAAQLQTGAAAGRRAFRPAGAARIADRAHPAILA